MRELQFFSQKALLCLGFLILFFSVQAQENLNSSPSPITKIDSLYREDQFYVGLTYNVLKVFNGIFYRFFKRYAN
jgi:hypothetical protein